MSLWLLTRPEGDVGWDEKADLVVRADSESQARELARAVPGDEDQNVWLAPRTACVEIDQKGPPAVLLVDFHAG